ncbi:MAG: outer membrane protein assembly factor BamD, partial [Bdellovibrionaceae bacterium]|nr:outer membrane protein assembly factor BamD [Pseudobdellovibrionaceae bacterium]
MMKLIVLPLIVFALLTGCSSAEKRSDTPDGLFAIAQEYEASDRYELAILRYTEVKNKFPYSSFATKAELAIADVHFKAESWPEAQVSYQAFRELHPTHSQVPYVVYRTGLSFYEQVPTSVDRDLTLA